MCDPVVLRTLLDTATPLQQDCGLLCGSRCCRSLEGEETGMLPFPGEEALFAHLPGFRLVGNRNLIVCEGTCDRSLRPLSCRIFPLLPVLRQGEIRVEMDERARYVCPMFSSGSSGLLPDFVNRVRKAGQILAGSEQGLAFLQERTREQDELKEWRRTRNDH